MNKLYITLLFLFTTFIGACASHDTTTSDFDLVCKITKENMTLKGTANEKTAKISEKVLSALNKDSKAAIAFRSVASADPSKKYDLFKQIAEQETGRPWNCSEMQKLVQDIFKRKETRSQELSRPPV